jgi:LPS export ABC transporter permease LptG
MTIQDLQARIAELRSQNISPHREIMTIHKKFSVPVACFVFAVIGLALGASNRKDGKLAAFVVGIAVIFVYYVIMFTAEALTKGGWVPAWLSMWLPNIFLGAAGVILLVSRARSADQPIRIPIPAALARWRQRPESSANAEPSTAPRGPKGRAVLVVRIPHFEVPRPSLLDIYIGKQYLRILGMTTVGMLGLFYISTFIDLSDKLFKGQAGIGLIGAYLFWATPQFLSYVLALAVLLSALVTVGLLTKNSELIVMRACGISLYRTAMPMVMFALIASAILFGLEEQLLAASNQRAEQLNHLIRTGAPLASGVVNRQWLVGSDGEVYHYQYYDPRNRQLNNLSVFQFNPKTHDLQRRIFVQRATYAPQNTQAGVMAEWLLDRGWQRDFNTTAHTSSYAPITSAKARFEAADYFATEKREPEMMNFVQLRDYIKELQASGYNVLEHQVWLQRKIAFPFVTLVMTLIAVPFAVTTGRRGAMYGIGVGIVLALVYWTMISVFAAFGQGGLISPVLAAWAPNIIFGAAAAYLLLTVRT